MPLGRARRWTFIAATVIFALAIIEGGAALTTRLLVSRGWMAEIPRLSGADIDSYLAARDAQLGWGDVRAERHPHPCAAIYGDSFMAGVDGPAYPEELSRILNCPVENYGVGGYGSDQAAMLADLQTQSGSDSSTSRILAHVSENILRNVNQYRNLLYPGQRLFFKPRFVFDGNRLAVLPPPVQSAADFQRLLDHPDQVLTSDAFLDRPRRMFPFTLSLLRWMASDFHVGATLHGAPRHQAFYSPAHPSGAFAITVAMLTTFAQQSGDRLIVLIPVSDDFIVARRDGRWPDQPLALALRAGDHRPCATAVARSRQPMTGARPDCGPSSAARSIAGTIRSSSGPSCAPVSTTRIG
jgi:hypothetical protein